MGLNTTIVLLNDGLHMIRDDKDVGKKLYSAVQEVGSHAFSGRSVDVSCGGHVNAIQVIETHHADMNKLISVGGNTGIDLGPVVAARGYIEEGDLKQKLLREFANEMGYDLHRKRRR